MSIEAGVRTHLLGKATVAAITNRIHTLEIPEDENLPDEPVMVLSRQKTDNTVSNAGDSNMGYAVVRAECIAATQDDAKALAEAVRNDGTNGFQGAMGNYYVQGCFVGDIRDMDPNLSPTLAAYKRFGSEVDLEVWFEQSTVSS